MCPVPRFHCPVPPASRVVVWAGHPPPYCSFPVGWFGSVCGELASLPVASLRRPLRNSGTADRLYPPVAVAPAPPPFHICRTLPHLSIHGLPSAASTPITSLVAVGNGNAPRARKPCCPGAGCCNVPAPPRPAPPPPRRSYVPGCLPARTRRPAPCALRPACACSRACVRLVCACRPGCCKVPAPPRHRVAEATWPAACLHGPCALRPAPCTCRYSHPHPTCAARASCPCPRPAGCACP